MAALDLDLLNGRSVAFDHLRSLVHRVGGKNEIVIAGNEQNGRVDFTKSFSKIASARDKGLARLDKVEEMVGVRGCSAPICLRYQAQASIAYLQSKRQLAGSLPSTAHLRPNGGIELVHAQCCALSATMARAVDNPATGAALP